MARLQIDTRKISPPPPPLSAARIPPLSLTAEQARFLCSTFVFAVLSYESRLNRVITECMGDINEMRSEPVVITSCTKRFPTTKENGGKPPDYESPISLASCSALALTSSIVPTM